MNTPIGKSNIKIEIIRSSRKTLAIEIRPDMRVIVRAPYQASGSYIEQFIADRTDWIVEHLRKLEQKNRQCNDALPVLKHQTIVFEHASRSHTAQFILRRPEIFHIYLFGLDCKYSKIIFAEIRKCMSGQRPAHARKAIRLKQI